MPDHNELSDREQEVINQLLEGKSNKLIAYSLSISERTVEFHLKNIYEKYQVRSRVELVLKLRSSTVAGQGEVVENRARPKFDWATFLREAVSQIGQDLKMTNIMSSDASSTGSPMTFFEAIRVCLIKYAEFSGRATRAEFWWFALFVSLGVTALAYVSESLGGALLIALLLPLLAAGTRRLRDSGRSGWWQLFLLVPVAGLVLVGILWALPPASPRPDDAPPA